MTYMSSGMTNERLLHPYCSSLILLLLLSHVPRDGSRNRSKLTNSAECSLDINLAVMLSTYSLSLAIYPATRHRRKRAERKAAPWENLRPVRPEMHTPTPNTTNIKKIHKRKVFGLRMKCTHRIIKTELEKQRLIYLPPVPRWLLLVSPGLHKQPPTKTPLTDVIRNLFGVPCH